MRLGEPSVTGAGRLLLVSTSLCSLLWSSSADVGAQQPGPRATLVEASESEFAGDTDSNSPGIWELVDGRRTLFVLNSHSGRSELSVGRGVSRLMTVAPISWHGDPPIGGVWMEAVVADDGGAWYGYYHNELGTPACPGSLKMFPRIGAARSTDRGLTWQDLGTILEAPPGSVRCFTNNHYFHGGVGDLSVALDREKQFLYVFYSQYLEQPGGTGVSLARMSWARRDEPSGALDIYQAGAWIPAEWYSLDEAPGESNDGDSPPGFWLYPASTPVHLAPSSWDDEARGVDVFWGPSVHWNTYLEQWVMLLNRANSNEFGQAGIYVSYSSALDQPESWSAPVRLLQGGEWYPQVMGIEPGRGTDKEAGGVAHFFMGGKSAYTIRFAR